MYGHDHPASAGVGSKDDEHLRVARARRTMIPPLLVGVADPPRSRRWSCCGRHAPRLPGLCAWYSTFGSPIRCDCGVPLLGTAAAPTPGGGPGHRPRSTSTTSRINPQQGHVSVFSDGEIRLMRSGIVAVARTFSFYPPRPSRAIGDCRPRRRWLRIGASRLCPEVQHGTCGR